MRRIQIAFSGFAVPLPLALEPRDTPLEEGLSAPKPLHSALHPFVRHHQRHEGADRNQDPKDGIAARKREPHHRRSSDGDG